LNLEFVEDLQIKDKTKAIELNATLIGSIRDILRILKASFEMYMTLNRKDIDVILNQTFDKTGVQFSVEVKDYCDVHIKSSKGRFYG
jgi:polyisoprenoid-binding protein YceI